MSDAGGIKALRVRVRAEGGDCLPGGGGSFFFTDSLRECEGCTGSYALF